MSALEQHPRGLYVIAMTEVWERMSYYGMRALLIYYMIKQLLYSQQSASSVYGLYTAAVWLAPLPGGLIADRWLGQRRAVYIGGTLMALGHFLLIWQSLFLPGLGAIVIGNGLFKPNISTQVGDLYPAGDDRRDRAYSIYYLAVNFGALIAPLICGTIGELFGWDWGFSLAGLGMCAGLVIYTLGRRHLPPDRLPYRAISAGADSAMTVADTHRLLGLAAIAMAATFFWLVFEQQGNTIALWADTFTDRHLLLGATAFTIPATWFQALNGLFIIILTPAVVGLWRWQARRGREPGFAGKLTIGALLGAVAYLLLALSAWRDHPGTPVNCLWLVLYFAVITAGELYLSPTALSLFNRLAPSSLVSTMVGVWYLSLCIGSYLAGFAGQWWDLLPKSVYFLSMSGLALLSAGLLAASATLLARAPQGGDGA